MTVLIADDDPVSRRILREILAADPRYEVTEACTGLEAWQRLENGPPVAIAFLDISMPEPGGIELLRRIHATPRLREIPTILCTASHDRATVIEAAAAGARHYIVKPAASGIVHAKLQQILGATSASAA